MTLFSDIGNLWLLVPLALLAIGWYGRGIVDFLRGLKPVKDGWRDLVYKVNEISDKLRKLQNTVEGMKGEKYARSQSPTSLTQKGIEVANKINADALIEKYSAKVQINDKATAYAIQQTCFQFALDELPDLITNEEMKLVEETAFREGTEKETIFRVVLGVLLRDKILNSKGIPIEQVDE